MFDLTPISTTNLFTAVQILVVIVGFFFARQSLEATRKSVKVASDSLTLASENVALATSNAQVQLVNQIVVQGRDLQYKFIEIFSGGSSPQDVAAKKKQFLGTVIGYYASCFVVRNMLTLPIQVVKLLDADLQELMREKQVREKWEEVKHLHGEEFVRYVDGIRGGVK